MEGEVDKDIKNIIVANNNTVDKNCFTFLEKEEGKTRRSKFYNKFAQSLESQAVRSNLGTHLFD